MKFKILLCFFILQIFIFNKLFSYPIANTGNDIFTTINTKVQLNGQPSQDDDPYTLKYYWNQIEGPETVEINNQTQFNPYFYLEKYGAYKFEMTITNTAGRTDKDIINVYAIPETEIYELTENILIIDTGLIYDTFIRQINISVSVPKEIIIPIYNSVTNSFNDTLTLSFYPSPINLKLIIYKINGFMKKGINYLSEYDKYQHTIIGFNIYNTNNVNLNKSNNILRYGELYNIEYSHTNNIYQNSINNLQIFAFAENKNIWLPLTGQISNNKITADTNFLYTFGLFEKSPDFETTENLSNIKIYPNPFKPNDGNEFTGVDYTGIPGTGIYFNGLKENTKIQIVDMTGKEIYSSSTNSGYYQWSAKDKKNNFVASGLYIINFKSNRESVVKKLLIIR